MLKYFWTCSFVSGRRKHSRNDKRLYFVRPMNKLIVGKTKTDILDQLHGPFLLIDDGALALPKRNVRTVRRVLRVLDERPLWFVQ